ncbi:tryptophan synthase subunit alpha [Halosquirtibacter laminarini]|uniref:Tryptophan synthase subunit alpha n=1 Tax=Halosquirtibacter laminarini TaxID=3374600 RepID=A0AC61NEU5_9BACT|nr:tryptophan synthase subunit alpha [Prolixibacteraceae bacterium]
MNRIQNTFQEKESNILSIYFTAGQKGLNKTVEIISSLESAGVDMVEIGIPFSDPVADGPTIQKSSEVAIKNGMTLKQLFTELKELRKKAKIPVLLMGYLNPILQYGIESFCKSCAEVGVDGVIIPDLPLNIYERLYQDTFDKHHIINTLLITPQTSEARIRDIDNKSKGFIYVVSSNGTTGDKNAIIHDNYFEHINSMKLKTPQLIGFGINDNQSFRNACKYSYGAIIGSAFVKEIALDHSYENIKSFIDKIVKNNKNTLTEKLTK